MFETALLASIYCAAIGEVPSTPRENAALARAVSPGWPHAIGAIADVLADDLVSLPETTSTISGDVPPSPAVLNSRGCQNAAAAWGSLPGIDMTTVILGPPIDSSDDPRDLSPVTDEVAAILDKCEAASREIQTLEAKINRTVYNLVFEVEKQAEGELRYQSPDKLSLDLRPTEILPGNKGLRVGRPGKPFRLESDDASSWLWLPDQIAMANPDERTFERTHKKDLPLLIFRRIARPPFLVGVNSQQVRREWNLTTERHRDQSVILRAVPRTAAGNAQCVQCLVMVNTKTWQVDAIKIFDPSGNLETVYQIKDRTINQPLPPGTFDPAAKWQGFKERH